MRAYYKKITTPFVALLLLSSLILAGCIWCSKLTLNLLPLTLSDIPWRAVVSSDTDEGGTSRYKFQQPEQAIQFDFTLIKSTEYPYVSYALRFARQEQDYSHYIDLSAYTSAVFKVQCNPANMLTFTVYTFDENISAVTDLKSYRIHSAPFSCEPHSRETKIKLDTLETPGWWLTLHADLANKNYSLRHASSITFGNSTQSPIAVESSVVIDSLRLEGRNWTWVYSGAGLLMLFWIMFAIWAFKQYSTALLLNAQIKLKNDVQFIACQQLKLEPHQNSQRGALMQLLATTYADPDLDMDSASKQLGIDRTTINDILKEELGMTFNSYLNKIRITEAARLLAENTNANVAEVAYAVGYNNVPYFNRLFKNEYGCAPGTFKSIQGL